MFEWFACIAARLKIIALKRAETKKACKILQGHSSQPWYEGASWAFANYCNPEVSMAYSRPASLNKLSWLGAPVFLLFVGPLLNNIKLAFKVSNPIVCHILLCRQLLSLTFALPFAAFVLGTLVGLVFLPDLIQDRMNSQISQVLSNPLDSIIASKGGRVSVGLRKSSRLRIAPESTLFFLHLLLAANPESLINCNRSLESQ